MNQTNAQLKERVEKNKPKIYVACLASYNAGVLHGKWIVPSTDIDELQNQIDEVLKTSRSWNADEFAIHDYDNFYDLGEYPNLEDIIKIQEAYKNHCGGYEVVNAFLENWQVADLDNLDDAFISWGWDSFQDFADHEADNMIESMWTEYGIEKDCPLINHFDYESYSRSLAFDYWHFDSETQGTLIFNKNW